MYLGGDFDFIRSTFNYKRTTSLKGQVVLICVEIQKALFMEFITQRNTIPCTASLYNASVRTDHTALYQLKLNRFEDFFL